MTLYELNETLGSMAAIRARKNGHGINSHTNTNDITKNSNKGGEKDDSVVSIDDIIKKSLKFCYDKLSVSPITDKKVLEKITVFIKTKNTSEIMKINGYILNLLRTKDVVIKKMFGKNKIDIDKLLSIL